MKASLASTLAIAGILLAAAGGSLVLSARWRSDVARERMEIGDYSAVMGKLQDASTRADRLRNEGEASYTYQLSVGAREALPSRLGVAVEVSGMKATGGRDINDTRAEMSLSGSHVNAIRFLASVEKDFPELRLRSCTWAAMSDGSVTLTAIWDIWQIPKPTT